MKKQLSYEELQEKVLSLEKELKRLKDSNLSNYNSNIFYEICEYSKNAIALFETFDNGNSFKIKYFNKKAAEVENVNREEIIGKDLIDVFPNILNSGFYTTLKRVFETNFPEEFPAIVLSSNSVIEWKHNFIYKLTENEIVSIYLDETDKKNREYELKEHREKLQIAMEAANFYSFEVNFKLKKIKTYHELYTSLGYKSPEIFQLMKSAGSLIHSDDYQKTLELIKNTNHEENASVNIEIRVKNKNENWIWFRLSGKVVEWENKISPLRFVGLIKNIQEEKEIQLRINESEKNFRQLAENINDAFWLRSEDLKLIYTNPACKQIVGERFREIFENSENYKQFIHPDDRERILSSLKKNSKFPEKVHYYEHRIIDSNDNVKWLWIRSFPVSNEDGKIYRRAGIASDITEQKRLFAELLKAKEKAEESDNLKSAFLANMSHEIRTPMNGILGFAELLNDPYISNIDKEHYLKIIDNNGRQLLNLINDIIDIAKIEVGQLQIIKTQFNINNLLTDIYNQFLEQQERNKKEHINFNLVIPAHENNEIYTDINRLRQILYNLLDNAFKFTNNGTINLGYNLIKETTEDYYQFFISDTGIGINDTMKELIFERFGQIQLPISKNRQGTGLGLSISKGITDLLKGKIWFESDPGNGSTFYFTIPYINLSDKHQEITSEIKNDGMKKWDNVKILIVEDDEDNLEFLRRLLIRYGAIVYLARNGHEAINTIKNDSSVQIVLMDIKLPDIDGFETTKQIKEIRPKLPVIAQTAYAMYNDCQLCLDQGCDDYIAKPLDKHLLFKKINKYLYN